MERQGTLLDIWDGGWGRTERGNAGVGIGQCDKRSGVMAGRAMAAHAAIEILQEN